MFKYVFMQLPASPVMFLRCCQVVGCPVFVCCYAVANAFCDVSKVLSGRY